MNRHEIQIPPFGSLFKEGRYGKVWHGSLALSCFDEPFDLIVRGSMDGPLPGQIDAIRRILSDADGLKDQATIPMVEMFVDCDLPTPAPGMLHDGIWDMLRPAFIEVADESYTATAALPS